MGRRISIALKLLATGTFSLLLTACYGTVAMMYGVPAALRSGVIKVITKGSGANPVAVPGIKISLMGAYAELPSADDPNWLPIDAISDQTGSLAFSTYMDYHRYYAKLEDANDPLLDNGADYATTIVVVDEDPETVEIDTVVPPSTGN
jgi:hypothetical protein